LTNYIPDTRSGTIDGTSLKAMIHTMEALITQLNTNLRDTPFTLQKEHQLKKPGRKKTYR